MVGLLSEGPRWQDEEDALFWVDILGSQLHLAKVGGHGLLEVVATIELDRHIGAAAPVAGGGTSSSPARASC
jgi:SMP-30/gluconolaconase/LRE-like protein